MHCFGGESDYFVISNYSIYKGVKRGNENQFEPLCNGLKYETELL